MDSYRPNAAGWYLPPLIMAGMLEWGFPALGIPAGDVFVWIFAGLTIWLTLVQLWSWVLYRYAEAAERYRMAYLIDPKLRMGEILARLDAEGRKLLQAYGRPVWEVDPWHAYFGRGSDVTFEFADYFLKHSTRTELLPVSHFSDRSYKFDASRQVEDRELVRQTTANLCAWGMAAIYTGNQRAVWVNGWDPDKVRAKMSVPFLDENERRRGVLQPLDEEPAE